MAAVVIDGKALAAKTKERVAAEAKAFAQRPGLAVILVGNDPASRVYVTSKRRDCEECGFYSEEFALPEEIGQRALLELVDTLNERPEIDGILCQLPLPKGYDYDEQEVLLRIDPGKDVDAFHPANVGKIMIGNYDFLPCTPAGVMEMLEEYGIDPAGKHCVVVGRSNIVGKPQAMLLLHKHGTVTICHSKTPDLAEITRQADILVAAVGRVGLITADMVKPGAVVIDVAMNRNEAGKLCGDVEFGPVSEIASYITPVPGGVGPMTRAMLMKNTLTAARLHGKMGKICQSCGMPIISDDQLGTDKDGSINADYCKYCYENGEFIHRVTMEEYIGLCAQFGAQAGLTNAAMKEYCKKLFPALKRWKVN